MVDPKPKLELPCPRCGALNGPAALRCRDCSHELEATGMAHWPQPTPFDLPGATAACPACGSVNAVGLEACAGCGEALAGPGIGLVEEAVVKATRQSRSRPRRSKVGPLLNRAGWARMAAMIRVVALLVLMWSVLDGALWLNNAVSHIPPQDHAAATRFTVHAVYELVRNCVLVGAVWVVTMVRPAKDV